MSEIYMYELEFNMLLKHKYELPVYVEACRDPNGNEGIGAPSFSMSSNVWFQQRDEIRIQMTLREI